MRPPKRPWHLLPATSAGGEPCWLLLDKKLPRGLGGYLDQAGPFFHYDEQAELWYFDSIAASFLILCIEGRYGTTWCGECLKGTPCEAWDVDRLLQEGFEPRNPTRRTRGKRPVWRSLAIPFDPDPRVQAVQILGVSEAPTKKEVQKAFRALALKAHPDQGGSDQAMRQLIEARDTLLEP